MTIIDHSSIKRVSQDDGLESITLRSDLAARYTFLNETLLEGIGAVSVDDRFKTMLGLKEIIRDDDNTLITDETAFLRRWEQRLQADVAQLEQTGAQTADASAENPTDVLDTLLHRLDNPFPAPSSLDGPNASKTIDETAILAAFDAHCEHVTKTLGSLASSGTNGGR